MALVKKANTELTVPEEKIKEYLNLGYSLIDKSGKVLEKGKLQSKDDLASENEELKSRVSELEKTIAKLEKQLKSAPDKGKSEAGKDEAAPDPKTEPEA